MTSKNVLKNIGIFSAGIGFTILSIVGLNAYRNIQEIEGQKIEFYGKHQAGITTPAQKFVYFAVLNLDNNDKENIKEMFKFWTDYSVKLTNGEIVEQELSNHFLPPKDTGESINQGPNNLSITFGLGLSFFDKLGLNEKKIPEFKELPHFPKDQLREELTGGDICIQVCADDPQVAFHALRNLVRKERGNVSLKWIQSGFLPKGKETPRNLFGFKDGTVNPNKNSEYDKEVWYDKDNWFKDGTFLIVRKIQMFIDTWDRTNLQEQENTFGRYKKNGAPFGSGDEFSKVDMSKLPVDSHVFLARKANSKILRRGFSYADGVIEGTGQFDTGLLFISFQKDPEQFIKIQNMLGADDKLNEYIKHIGSGIFAVLPGVEKGEYLGQDLFE